MKLLTLYLFTSLVLISCGTTQLSVPPRPLRNNENEFRVGFGYNLCKYTNNDITIQFNFYRGISDRDIIGLSFNDFIFPSRVSYIHYWEVNNNFGGNFQAHWNPIGWYYDPTYEVDCALSHYNNNISQSIKFGFGKLDYHAGLQKSEIRDDKCWSFPILGYTFQMGNFQFETEYLNSLTKYDIDYYYSPPFNHSHYYPDKYIFRHDSVLKIVQKPFECHIILKDSTIMILKNKNTKENESIRSFYTNDTAYKVYDVWLIKKLTKEPVYPIDSIRKEFFDVYFSIKDTYLKDSTLIKKGKKCSKILNYLSVNDVIELKMNKILNEYYSGKDLIIIEDSTLKDKKKSNVQFWDDINFGIGYMQRGYVK